MARLRTLISGAGPGGISLAFWLQKLGHKVTIIERFPGLRVNGLQVDLRSYGIDVIKIMGLEHAIRATAAPEMALQIVDTKGKRWGYFPANKSGSKAQSITSDIEIMRGDLCKVLYDATKDQAEYIFGTSIESYEEKTDSVEVRFSDGRIDQFDLVVGADGLGSRTRRMMLGGDVKDGFYPIGECAAYFTVPQPIQEGETYDSTMYIATGDRSILIRRNNDTKLQVYLISKDVSKRLESVKKGNVKEEKDIFNEVFRGAGWKVDYMLDQMMECEDFYCERKGLVKIDAWSKGRVTLVGDACYSPAGDFGIGTTCAMVGAYVLAGEIGKHYGRADDKEAPKENLRAALEAYETTFRPFMTQIQKGIGEPSIFDKFVWKPFTLAIAYRFISLASLLRLDLVAGWLLDQKVGGWNLPHYKELKDLS
jgi:2-polyprenyl-6-methoxyphenol hydroxylase-like FAD-dependent oxidoreductase